jgi:hypothetical protein
MQGIMKKYFFKMLYSIISGYHIKSAPASLTAYYRRDNYGLPEKQAFKNKSREYQFQFSIVDFL